MASKPPLNPTLLFRKLIFAQVLVGVLAFCIAERNPAMLLITGALGALSWYVVEGPTGKPLSRWVINLGSLLAVGYLLLDLKWQSGKPHGVLIAMGHFTMCLQILELYTKKTNRDYGLILILSLLQMVGASVLSVSLIFGLLLAVYCALLLVTLTFFHMKTGSDRVIAQNQKGAPPGIDAPIPHPVVGRGHRWQLRSLIGLVGLCCLGVAASIFVLMPRTSRHKERGGVQLGWEQTVGFTERVHLGVSPGKPNRHDAVLNLSVEVNQENVGSDQRSWLLRGAALDRYDPYNHIWKRSPSLSTKFKTKIYKQLGEGQPLLTLPPNTVTLDAQITLRQTESKTLFSLHPTTHIQSNSFKEVKYCPTDQYLRNTSLGKGTTQYRVQSPLRPNQIFLLDDVIMEPTYAKGWQTNTDSIRKLTLDIIKRTNPNLSRDLSSDIDPNDHKIVTLLTLYLSDTNNFTYSLENPPVPENEDPIVDFLFKRKSGHCELFAAGLAAMTRSIGMRARLVTGYRASEFNQMGAYYVVRHSNAHAWTEVYCQGRGWVTFDATPPADVAAEHRVARSWARSFGELYDLMEVRWVGSVVTYDKETRESFLSDIKNRIKAASADESSWLGRLTLWVGDIGALLRFSPVNFAISAAIFLVLVLLIIGMGRHHLGRRRAVMSLQIDHLPRKERKQLEKTVRFYLMMVQMLESQGLVRPDWQTPQQFALQLVDQQPSKLGPVLELTDHFYEVRYGGAPLDSNRQDGVKSLLKRLEQAIFS